ncbi:MAG: signal recognition particle protein [Rhodospirillaceae bacterium]|nr:signal recognition particle protein [Rhodospirillaceae bacterium]
MFESLTGKLGEVFDRLRKRGALSEADVDAALREVRVALLEADVALSVVKDFTGRVRLAAVGQDVIRSVTPGQMVVKIVHDQLVELLGGGQPIDEAGINLRAAAPVVVLMVGLQGSGKTTTTAKIALRLKTLARKKVLMASLDTRRPAAQEQLAVLGTQVDVATLPIVIGEQPEAITRRALDAARREGCDVLLLDTAGRLHIDDELMAEARAIGAIAAPTETLLVVDAMTGQDAVNLARAFNEQLGVTGIVMTRVDGDARGGAALSMRAVTGRPIKLIGTGEKPDALEIFQPDRIASRILGMGDIIGLVERAAETVERDEAEKIARKLQKGDFDLDDMASQLRQIRRMGGLSGVMGMLPSIGQIKQKLAGAKVDERVLRRQEAIIGSMTRGERRNVKLLNASRKRRIAGGSGTSVEDVNRLIKQCMEMSRIVKQVGHMGQKGLARQGMAALTRRH